jgi:pyrroline-5-carboxylate reductase
MYIQALIDVEVANGMDWEQARIFLAQSVLGAAKMVLETGLDPITLRDNVCTPGGTTIEGVNILQNSGFNNIVVEALNAAIKKSKLMTK